jgi:Cu+-exporting ATPase
MNVHATCVDRYMEIGSVVRKDSFHPLDLLDHRGDDMSSPADSATEIDLAIGGMTCASCAMHVERSLNKVPGVTATVNFATQKAHVVLPAQVSVADAITAVEATGYTATVPAARSASPSADESPEGAVAVHALRTRLTVCLILAIPVVLLSMIPFLQFTYWQWACLALAAPVVVWGALPFHRAAWVNLRHRAVTMDTLVSLGVLAAFGWSLYALFIGGAGMPGMHMEFVLVAGRDGATPEPYLEVAAGVTVFLLLGRYLEARASSRSSQALRLLLELGAKDVTVVRDGRDVVIPIGDLRVDDTFVVRPGDTVATDGVVIEGTSSIDTSVVTGEPVPVDVAPGDRVIGATVNVMGRLLVRATRVGADTQLAQMGRMVEAAQSGKAPVQRLADRVSAYFVPVVLALAVVTLAGWLISGASVQAAFTAAVAVLIIACPCALGLATPTALLVGTGRGAQLGILIRGPQVLESTRRIDTVVLDKTGTVTTAHMQVVDVVTVPGWTREEVLLLAAPVEDASGHPVAMAVARAAGGSTRAVRSFVSVPGLGASGVVDGRTVAAGRVAWLLHELAVTEPADLARARARHESDGRTVVGIAIDGEAVAIVAVSDTVRPTSADAIARLRALGLAPVLLTGDNESAARTVANEVGIDDVISQVLPQDKVDAIRHLQGQGRTVAMIGDGVNDAAALAQADLGMAMGAGTDIAIEAADITLVRSDLLAAVDAIRLSRRTIAVIIGNLIWAFGYNVAAIPLAMAGLLNPLIAGAAMAFSSVFVVTNSLRLRRFRSVER